MIVAIEPDRRRAAQLTGMARAHLHDELVVASSAAQAVDALNGRVPDVLLTAPLLPSQEETAIADYLRQLGAAAAHVQTLTIPLLASASGERDRPVLSAFRRGKTQRVESEGCDPAVFAEQITEYLREARERKVVVQAATARAAVDAVESPAQAHPIEPDLSSFAVDNAPPPSTGRRFKELLARFDVDEADYPAVNAPALSEGPARKQLPAGPTPESDIPMTVNAETDLPTLDAEGIPAFDAASLPPTFVLPEPARATSPSHMDASERRNTAHPQDDWALFDPNQCGFPALIAKLDEIASREGDR